MLDSIAPFLRFVTLVALFTAAGTWIQVVRQRNTAGQQVGRAADDDGARAGRPGHEDGRSAGRLADLRRARGNDARTEHACRSGTRERRLRIASGRYSAGNAGDAIEASRRCRDSSAPMAKLPRVQTTEAPTGGVADDAAARPMTRLARRKSPACRASRSLNSPAAVNEPCPQPIEPSSRPTGTTRRNRTAKRRACRRRMPRQLGLTAHRSMQRPRGRRCANRTMARRDLQTATERRPLSSYHCTQPSQSGRSRRNRATATRGHDDFSPARRWPRSSGRPFAER